jgi:hypothetical protein
MCAAVVQLYTVGIILSAAFATVLNPWFWKEIMAVYWP